MPEEASYICDSCGEEIVIPIDLSAGAAQQYVEDCPVCCHPNVLWIELDESGEVSVRSEHE
jgi:Cysteine-rich CPXCG